MFTGIISDIGKVLSVSEQGDVRIQIACGFDMSTVKIGESIACNGVCLTVVENNQDSFSVDVSHETIRLTIPSMWRIGACINLERALRMGDDVSGHMVTGHVDGLATLVSLETIGGSYQLNLEAPAPLHRFIATKGSVTLNGISLTVNEVSNQQFTINIIPHTWEKTNLQYVSVGDAINLEIDVLARYMARLIETKDDAK